MNFTRGTRVAFSVQFLKSIGEAPLGEMCHWRGEVLQVVTFETVEIAHVLWDHDKNEVFKANLKNLAVVGPNSKFCAC